MQKFYRAGVFLGVCALLLGSASAALAQTEVPAFQLGDSPFGGGGDENPVTLQAEFSHSQGNAPARLFITATIKTDWHIYSITQAAGGPIKTEIKLPPSNQFKLLGDFKAEPKPKVEQKPLEFPGVDIESHEDTVTWYAPIELAAGVDAAALKIAGTVTYQSCLNDSCRAPQSIPFIATLGKGIDVPGDTAPNAAANPAIQQNSSEGPTTAAQIIPGTALPMAETAVNVSLLEQLGWAFLGGLILNLMPCVLPVLSLKLFSFVKQAGESRMRIFALNVFYSAGLLSVFLVLATLAAGIGLSWGEQFTKPWFKVTMTGLVFAMALSFLGVWEIPIPGFAGSGKAMKLQQKEGLSGAFFKGVFTTILATPCGGPFLGSLFGYLLKQPPYVAYLVLGSAGVGMASPYLIIGAFPKLIAFLPKPGAWMKVFEELMGFLMLGAVLYLFTTLSTPYFIPTLTLCVGLWFAVWLIGRTPITASPTARAIAWIAGPAVAAVFGLVGFRYLFDIAEVKYAGESPAVVSAEGGTEIFRWHRYTPEALAKARAEGKTVMVDFWARWCLTCQTNSKVAIETEAVSKLIKQNKVVPMLADWTDESPDIKKALNDLGRNSIPVLAIWPAGAADNEVIVRSDLLSQADVLAALEQAGPSK